MNTIYVQSIPYKNLPRYKNTIRLEKGPILLDKYSTD